MIADQPIAQVTASAPVAGKANTRMPNSTDSTPTAASSHSPSTRTG